MPPRHPVLLELPPGDSQSHTNGIKHARKSCRRVWFPALVVKSHWFGPVTKVVTLEAELGSLGAKLGSLGAKLGQTESLVVQNPTESPQSCSEQSISSSLDFNSPKVLGALCPWGITPKI